MPDQDLLQRRLDREVKARKMAEQIAEEKSLDLYQLNEKLESLNHQLEEEVKRRTKELVDSEIKYESLVESLNDIIYRTDDKGNFTYINEIGFKSLGFSKEEIIGKLASNIIHPHYRAKIEEDQAIYFTQKKESFYDEFPILTKSGETRWVGQNVRISYSEDNKIQGLAGVARDISKRKLIEEELQNAQRIIEISEQKNRSIIENMQIGLVEEDLEGRIVRPYPIFCKMVGYSADELLGKQTVDLIKDKTNPKEEQEIHEEQLMVKNGDNLWVLNSQGPFYDSNGNLSGSIGLYYDISNIKQLQKELENARVEAEAAQRAEKQFIANISHEIRTPLNAIIGMSYLLHDTTLSEEQEEYSSIINSSGNLLLKLISNVLDFSKIDAGKFDINEKPFNIKYLIETISKTFKKRMEEGSNDFVVEIDNRIENYFLSDELLLNQVLINLIGNAGKFTTNGKVSLILKLVNQTDLTQSVLFIVEDTGIGIRQEDIKIIFNKFQQIDSEYQSDKRGTGLGLPIAKKFIELLGGKISVSSELGKGSVFSFKLELKKTTQEIDSNEIKDLNEYLFENLDYPILIAEDNPMNQKYIARLLEKWNMPFEIADDGEAAVNLCKKQRYALIFMDIQMPKVNGLEATLTIKKMEHFKNVPIIALTAFSLPIDKEMAFKVGMIDFLSKPFKPGQLATKIQKHISAKVVTAELTDPLGNFNYKFNEQLDSQFLFESYGNDLEYALSMFETFLEVHEQEYSKIINEMSLKNWNEVRRIAHKIKPIFSMVGLTGLTEICKNLEQSALYKEEEEIVKYFKTITDQKDDYIDLIKDEIRSLKVSLGNK